MFRYSKVLTYTYGVRILLYATMFRLYVWDVHTVIYISLWKGVVQYVGLMIYILRTIYFFHVGTPQLT